MKQKQYVHFVGYNKLSKVPTLSLNSQRNTYCCSRCGTGGYAIGLYAKIRNISTKKAYKELLERECFSQDRVPIEISPINLISDIEIRDSVYRDFLSMLKLEGQHRVYLRQVGFLDTSIEDGLYKTVPTDYIKRRLICRTLSEKYNLSGIPGFEQQEDFKWYFPKYKGFFVPVFDKNGLIQGLSIHLDKEYNNNQDIWFSSTNKINGTSAKSWIMEHNITENTEMAIITDNFLLGNFINEVTGLPVIAFQNITNSYTVLKEVEKNNIKDITFVFRLKQFNNNIDYITNRIFRNLMPLGYELKMKLIREYKEIFDIDFSVDDTLIQTA